MPFPLVLPPKQSMCVYLTNNFLILRLEGVLCIFWFCWDFFGFGFFCYVGDWLLV